jgi:hypothetical protein
MGLRIRARPAPDGERRHRVQGADVQRAVLPVLRQPGPASGGIGNLGTRHRPAQGRLELGVERLPDRRRRSHRLRHLAVHGEQPGERAHPWRGTDRRAHARRLEPLRFGELCRSA